MKRKLFGLFGTKPEIPNTCTNLQQTRIVPFVESGKHAKPACAFSAASQTLH